MSNITDWIKYELYPCLFESIDTALPEHDFKHFSGGWRSKTYLDGSPHKSRLDKKVVGKKALGYILEQRGEVIGLVDYVMRRDRIDFIQAVRTLAQVSVLFRRLIFWTQEGNCFGTTNAFNQTFNICNQINMLYLLSRN